MHPTPLRALVVNDLNLARWALHEALTAAGFEVTVAETAEAAISEFARLETLDVVVVSLSLGAEAVDRLKERLFARWPRAGVIILATDVEARMPGEAESRGIVLDTPFSMDDVVAAARVPVAPGAFPSLDADSSPLVRPDGSAPEA
jgi:DNA-binding NtrC family response regulator